jgi:carboxylate-amine ligase
MLTLGVEEEFLLVDADGRLAADGPDLAEDVGECAGQVEHELRRCQVESATQPCTDAGKLLTDLRGLRDRLATEAAERDLRLLPSGTALLADGRPPRFTPDNRYRRMAQHFGEIADVTLTCACHVHIGIDERADGVAIGNHIRSWLPVLLALTANSPFHNGTDTRYASWRYQQWSHWPSAGPPPEFGSVDDYEAGVRGLLRCGAILDRGMVYWDVRLSAHQPTVEVRIADVAPTVEHAALFAVLVRALATQALDGTRHVQVSQEVLRGRLWRASRDGLSGHCVDPWSDTLVPTWQLLDALVEELRPYLRANGDEDHVTETIAGLRDTGGAAERQRAQFARHNRLTDVIDGLVWHPAQHQQT